MSKILCEGKFEGTLVITDPCYFIKDDGENESDWDRCNYGLNLSVLGFNNYICTDNLYGNWSCTLYNLVNIKNMLSDDNVELSQFSSDSGLVGVFYLEDILKYDSEFNLKNFLHNEVAVVENFRGTVDIINRNNKQDIEAEVMVVGLGNINFFSLQTGF